VLQLTQTELCYIEWQILCIWSSVCLCTPANILSPTLFGSGNEGKRSILWQIRSSCDL